MEQESLEELAIEIQNCQKCPLSAHRMQAVPGAGSPTAPIFLLAEKPGYHEDQYGIPMVGEAGKLFKKLCAQADLSPDLFFITNSVRCMPPKKHRITLPELEACEEWTRKQLEIVQPKVLMVCGTIAVGTYYPGEQLGRIHGVPRRTWEYIIFPTYHPAAALYNEKLVPVLQRDFQTLSQIVSSL